MQESSIDLPVKADRGVPWVISVLEDELVFRKTDGTQVQRISRRVAPRSLEIVGLSSSNKPLIAAQVPDRVIFHLTSDQAEVIRRWLSPLDDEYVRAIIDRYVVAWSIPVGILYLVDTHLRAMTDIDVLSAAAGLCLIATGILGKVRPRQGVLLLNAGTCAVVVLLAIARVFQDQSWWRLLLVYLISVLWAGPMIGSYRLITRLKKETPSPAGSTSR